MLVDLIRFHIYFLIIIFAKKTLIVQEIAFGYVRPQFHFVLLHRLSIQVVQLLNS